MLTQGGRRRNTRWRIKVQTMAIRCESSLPALTLSLVIRLPRWPAPGPSDCRQPSDPASAHPSFVPPACSHE